MNRTQRMTALMLQWVLRTLFIFREAEDFSFGGGALITTSSFLRLRIGFAVLTVTFVWITGLSGIGASWAGGENIVAVLIGSTASGLFITIFGMPEGMSLFVDWRFLSVEAGGSLSGILFRMFIF